MAEKQQEKKYLKWYQKVAYGAGDLASNCSYGLVSTFVLLYLTGTLGLNAVFYTANGIAYSSLTALITKNNNERVQLGSIRFMFAVVTNIVMGFTVTNMVEKFGGGAAGWRTTALIFAIIGLVVNTISCLAVKELPEEELKEGIETDKEDGQEEKVGFIETARLLIHNKYYLQILVIYIVYYIMSNLTTGAGSFFATYYWGDGSLIGQFSMMKMFPVIIALAVSPMIIKKVGSMQKVNFMGYLISCLLGIPMLIFAQQKVLGLYLLFMFLKGTFAGTLSGSLNALIAEASAYTTRTTGRRMDGMMYSCSSLGIKVGGGIGTAATGWLLALAGFDGKLTSQPASAIAITFHLYVTIPLLIGVVITILLAFLDVEKANKKWDEEHGVKEEVKG